MTPRSAAERGPGTASGRVWPNGNPDLYDPRWHTDNGHGGCVICHFYVPHTDDEMVGAVFPCAVVREAEATAAVPLADCVYCAGRRWTEDENWSPDDPATWRGERSHGDGLIPCGGCNEGGWSTPDYARLSADEEGGDLATEYAAEDEAMERLAAAKEAAGYDDD